MTTRYPQSTFVAAARMERLHASAGILDEIFARTQLVEHMPGLVFGLVADGAIVHSGAFGSRSIEHEDAPTTRTVFRIASMTKSFTAAAVLLLRDEGTLRLEDPSEEYVPQLTGLPLPSADSARPTVRNLLQMNAGWPQDDPWADRKLYLDDAAIDAITTTGLSYSTPPGTRFEYSNFGYILLGRIIQAASGIPAMQFITERLLDPLGMQETHWQLQGLEHAQYAPGYRYEDETWRAEEPLPSGGDVAAFAGLCSTVDDLARWVAMFLDAWPPRDDAEAYPLCRASVREMQTSMAPVAPTFSDKRLDVSAEPSAYAYGFGLQTRDIGNLRLVGHGGGLPGYGTHMLWAPEHGVGVVALSNVTYGPSGRACLHALQELLRRADAPRRVVPVSNHLLQAHDALNRLLVEWDDQVAADLFADNFFLDTDAERWRSRFQALREAHGFWRHFTPVVPQNWLRGEWRAQGERGWCSVWLSMCPTDPPRVQMLRLTGVLPPSETLKMFARKCLAYINGDGDDEWLSAASANTNVSRIRRALEFARARGGVFQLGTEVGGNGSSWAEFEVFAGRLLLSLEIQVDARDRLSSLILSRR